MGGLYVPAPPGSGISPPAGDIGGTAAAPTVTAAHLASPLPVTQGGTASGTAAGALSSLGAIAASARGAASGVAPLDAAGSLSTVPLLDHGGQVYNVKAYGAAGNGSADDTSAIQSAISAAVSSSGGVVYLPPGNYKLSSALTLSSHVSLVGAGANTTVLTQTSTTANAITVSAATVANIEVRDLRINGPGSGTGIGISIQNSTTGGASPCTGLVLRNLIIYNMGSHGVYLVVPITSTLDNIQSVNNLGHGFYLWGNNTFGTSTELVNCYANYNTQRGFWLQSMAYCSLNACAADGNGLGYEINGCRGIHVAGCGAESTLAAAGLDGTSFKIYGSNNVSVRDCYTSGNNAVAFYATSNAKAFRFDGVTELGPGGSATASVKVDAGCTGIVTGLDVITAQSYGTGTTYVIGPTAATTAYH